MNRKTARELAERLSEETIRQMLQTAWSNMPDWRAPSRVNKSITKGTAWNILTLLLEDTRLADKLAPAPISILGKTNMIWEFGEFLPPEYKPKSKKRNPPQDLIHQDPNPLTNDKKM